MTDITESNAIMNSLFCNVKVYVVRNYRSQYRTTQKRAPPAYIFSFQHFNQNLDIFWKLLMASWRKHTSNTEAQAGYRDIAWPDSTMVVCLLTTACYSQLIAVALPSNPAVLSWKSTFPRHLLAATMRTDSLALLDHKFAANIYQKSMFKAYFFGARNSIIQLAYHSPKFMQDFLWERQCIVGFSVPGNIPWWLFSHPGNPCFHWPKNFFVVIILCRFESKIIVISCWLSMRAMTCKSVITNIRY